MLAICFLFELIMMENGSSEDLDNEINDDHDYDDFFFDSIRRYSILQMFNLENVPHHLFQMDEASICVVSKHAKRDNSEILKLQLPDKLTLPPEEEGRSKGNDFKVLTGLYTENLVYKADKLSNDGNIITSEIDANGLTVYDLSHGSLGDERQGVKVKIANWVAPDFVVIGETNNLICSKCCHKPLIQIDMTAEKQVKEIRHPFYINIGVEETDSCEMNNIKSEVLNRDLIAILNENTGDTILHDLRTDNAFICLPGGKEKHDREMWTLSKCDSQSSLNHFGILSSRKSFFLYDVRINSILIQNMGSEELSPGELNNMKLKFNKGGDKFSISGMNSLVEIYHLYKNDFLHVFTHNGHSPCNMSNFITDHIWLHTRGKEFVISICDNKTLNSWDYNAVASF